MNVASKLLTLTCHNYSFFMTNVPHKGAFFGISQYFFPEEGFSFLLAASQKQTKVSGVRVESFCPGHETLGWCHSDKLSVLKPLQN